MEFNLKNEIARRENKVVYRDGDKKIKLFVENYKKSNILNEALNQAKVEEATNLKIPKLLEVTLVDNKRWALVSEYIEGTPLNELMDKHPEKEDEYLELFVNIQLEVLSYEAPLLNRIKDKFNASADVARTFLQFSMNGKDKLASKYLDLFSQKSGITKVNILRWVPIVAATQKTKGREGEQEFLNKWIDVIDFQ